MKNKLKWMVNLSTLALCICALAIGVYAAKQASLTTSGQIGFTAHNCEVFVSGTIDAYQENGETKLDTSKNITTGGNIPKTQVGGTNGVSTLNLPAMYFSDVKDDGNTITINLTTENNSAYKVKANISVTSAMPDGVKYAISSSTYTMEADGTTGYIKNDITITFTLASPETSADIDDETLTIVMAFEKDSASARDYLHRATTTNPYTGMEEGSVYVEMGSYNGTPLKWYAFAKDGAAFYTVDSLSDVQSGSYYFISEYVLGTSVFNETADGSDPAQVDYNGSVLQKAIIELQSSTTYKFSDSEIFNLITDRDLPSETYETDHNDDGIGTTSGSTGQKFWPLSFNETDEGEFGLLSAHGSSADYSNCKTCTVGGTTTSDWWLRSPLDCNSGYEYSYAYYYLSGNIGRFNLLVNYVYGLRAAFQLEIV